MSRSVAVLLAIVLLLAAAGCTQTGSADAAAAVGTSTVVTQTGTTGSAVSSFQAEDLQADVPAEGATTIELLGDTIRVQGAGASVAGSRVTIEAAGDYLIQGRLSDGQIVVDTPERETVRLILNGADISCSTSAAIYVVNAESTVMTLADGTVNAIADGASRPAAETGSDEPDAAIFSNDDLTINGGGSLTVVGGYQHGIASDDELRIVSGHITVTAVGDGLRGRDLLAIRQGTISVQAGSDALRASNAEEADRGSVIIEGGDLDLQAAGDGIQAETRLVVSGGTITIVAGGGAPATISAGSGWGPQGAPNQIEDAGDSARGLQAGVSLEITGGSLAIDAADDGLHSDGSLAVSGGSTLISSGDDGIHAEASVRFDGGELSITRSYEGIESASITVQDGIIRLVASDDGLNATAGGEGRMPGLGGFAEAANGQLEIHGGYLYLDAGGDGIDINGPITMTGGIVVVNGPTGNGNGAIDYLGEFEISGGLLIAVGSAGMAQAPSAGSSQNSALIAFPSVMSAGTLVHIETDSGQQVLTFQPAREFQTVVFSSPDLADGGTYRVYTGGASTGMLADGRAYDGTYTPGSLAAEFTVSSSVTAVGSAAGGAGVDFGGGRGGPGGPRP